MDTTSLKTITFGKWKGHTFEQVYKDKHYCNWILKTCSGKTKQSNALAFIDYVRQQDRLHNRTYDNLNSINPINIYNIACYIVLSIPIPRYRQNEE